MSPAPQPEPAAARARRVLVALPPDEFQQLAEKAERESRTPDQQARHIIREELKAQRTAGHAG